jgi:hypothetical protein
MLVREHQLSIQRACRSVRLSRRAYYQPPLPASRRDAAVIAALTDAVTRYPRWDFWKLFDRFGSNAGRARDALFPERRASVEQESPRAQNR